MDLPVTISGTRALIDAKINHQDIRLVVDSGAFFSMISSAMAQELKLKLGTSDRRARRQHRSLGRDR